MERTLKVLLLALLIVQLTLVPCGRLNISETIDLNAAVSTALALLGFRQALRARHRYRTALDNGAEPPEALHEAVSLILPSPIARPVASAIWAALAQRRHPAR